MKIFEILVKISVAPAYLWDAMWAPIYKRCMAHCGRGVYLRPMSSDIKGLCNLSVGDGTSIPKGSTFYCTNAPLTIGKKVVFGPKPTIITGDHRIDVIGKHIIDVTDEYKQVSGDMLEVRGERLEVREASHSSNSSNHSNPSNPSNPSNFSNSSNSSNPSNSSPSPYDQPVVIEDGCWIGANVTILKGVTIGRGSVVAAGAVVTKSCEPYSIIGGVPARLIRMRFTAAEIREHERTLGLEVSG